MKKKFNKKGIFVFIIIILLLIGCMFFKKDNKDLRDTVFYNGKIYVNLEYNMDIFTYGFNGNDYYEEDIIHPVEHDKWDMVYFDGDLFVFEKQVDEAKKYYADDNNYEWFVVFDKDDLEVSMPIQISQEELKYLYNMENMDKKETMRFEDIKQFASIVKISKDKMIYSLISLAHYKDSWYWKTEIMTDDDYEYVIILPESLNKKICSLRNK